MSGMFSRTFALGGVGAMLPPKIAGPLGGPVDLAGAAPANGFLGTGAAGGPLPVGPGCCSPPNEVALGVLVDPAAGPPDNRLLGDGPAGWAACGVSPAGKPLFGVMVGPASGALLKKLLGCGAACGMG